MAYRSPASLIDALGRHDSALDPSTPETYTAYMSTPDACPVKAAHALSRRYLGTPTLANKLSEALALAGGRPDTVLKDVVASTLAGSGFDLATADEAFASACAKDEGFDLSFGAAEGDWGSVFDVLRERDGAAVRRGAVASPVLERVRMEFERSGGGVEMFESAEVQMEDIKGRIEKLREGLEMEQCVESATWDEVRMMVWLGALHKAEESGGTGMKLLRKCRDKIRVIAAQKAVEQAREKGRSEVRAFEYVSQMAAAVEGENNVDVVSAILVDIFSVIVAGEKQGADATLRVSELFAWIREPEPSSEGVGGDSAGDDEDEVREVREAGVVVPEQHRDVLLKIIARPEVMALIWRKLFVRSAREAEGQPVSVPEAVNEPLRDCLAKLLALAAVYSRRLAEGFASSNVSPATGSDLPAARAPSSPLDSTEERNQVCALESMISSCAAVCSFLPPGSAAKGISGRTKRLAPMAGPLLCGKTCSEVLRDGIGKSEVLARGVLLWAREGLLEAKIGSRLARACLQYLIVLDCVAERWSSLRGDVLSVYADAYGRVWAKETDFGVGQKFEGTFARYFGKALVSMIRFQCGIQVLDLFRGRFVVRDNIAFAHLRTFVTELTSSLGLPLSASFEKALIALLTSGRVVAAFSQDPASSESENSSDSSERRDGGPAFAGISAELSSALQALKLKPPHPVAPVVGSPISGKGNIDGSGACRESVKDSLQAPDPCRESVRDSLQAPDP